MWLKTKVQIIEKKIKNNTELKIASDFKPALKKLKAKIKTLKGPVKLLKEKNADEYYSIRTSYRILVEAFASGKSVSSIEKAKKAVQTRKTTKKTEE